MRASAVHRFPQEHPGFIFGTLALLCLASCGSPGGADFFATGRDARTYNAQTGRYEWPADEAAKPRVTPRANRPAPERTNPAPKDGRVFNAQTGRFERVNE